MQLVSLVPLVGGPLCVALGVEFRLRLMAVISIYILSIVLWLIVIGLVNMRHQRWRETVVFALRVPRTREYARALVRWARWLWVHRPAV